MFTERIDQLESVAVDLVAKVAPWCAPLPTAYLVGRATVVHLAWPAWVGFVAAVIVESLGLATTATALVLRDYNQSKRKTDPRAPFALALALVGVYFVVATGLTVVLDISPGLAVYAPAIFPTLSLTGVTVLALRSDHKRRLADIESERAEKRAARQVHKNTAYQLPIGDVAGVPSGNGKSAQQGAQNGALDAVNRTRQERKAALLSALESAYCEHPDLGVTEAARQLGVHRNTIYGYLDELESAGRLRKNGNGWEVL